ncbi:unnamed protein product [Sphagnum balticum]
MKWSYQRYLAKTKITVRDDRTVEVDNPEPIAAILDIFTEFYICWITGDREPILGTGPYQVMEFDRAEGRAVLEIVNINSGDREGESLSQRPRQIIAYAEPSAEKRLGQVLQGSVDFALNLEHLENAIDLTPKLQWGRATNTLSIIFYLNCTEGIFSSTEAPLAVNHAIDTEVLALEVFHGLAIPATTVVSPFHLGSRNAAPIPYDPAKARRLLDGLAITRKNVVLRTPTYMPERAEAITAFVVSSLETVGLLVKVEIESDRASYARQVGLNKNIGGICRTALFAMH